MHPEPDPATVTSTLARGSQLDESGDAIRPRDLAMLLLASSDLRPRKRARDQRPDEIGLQLKRRLLDHVAAVDPDPENLETCLMQVVDLIGPPTGPTRALAADFRDEWLTACTVPEWVAQLVSEAVRESAEDQPHGGPPHS